MKVVWVYLRMYGECLTGALRGVGKNAWTLFLPLLLVLAFEFGGRLLSGLGFVGGILLLFVRAALFSCYLYFVSEIVSGAPVRITEFQKSIRVYFWSVVNVGFVLWVGELLLSLMLGSNPRADELTLALTLVALVALNAVPEIIAFRGSSGGLQTVQGALRFLQENPLEWLLPNLLWGTGLYVLFTRLLSLLPFPVGELLLTALIHLGFLFRGHLFKALDGSSHRQRMFKFRSGL